MLILLICLCHHFETARASSMTCVMVGACGRTSSFLRVTSHWLKKTASVWLKESSLMIEFHENDILCFKKRSGNVVNFAIFSVHLDKFPVQFSPCLTRILWLIQRYNLTRMSDWDNVQRRSAVISVLVQPVPSVGNFSQQYKHNWY